MSELRVLTSVRGIAAWLVVLYHIRLSVAGLPAGIRDVLGKGYLAVDFFFLLSGFVIWLTWHDRLGVPGATWRFWRKRVARIWPLHLAMLAVALALALLLVSSGRQAPSFPLATLPLHLMLVQQWGLTDPLTWNEPAWSISAELAAYILFPLLVALVDWRRWRTPALVAVAAAILGTLHLLMREEPTLGAHIARFGLARCLAEFTTGTVMAALWLRKPRAAVPMLVAGVLFFGWAAGVAETLVVPALFAATLLALALGSGAAGHPLEGRMLHMLGEASYATYLCHFLLWQLFKFGFVADAAAVPPLRIAAYLLLVLLASILLYHGLERPAQRWINRGRTLRPARMAPAE